MFCLTGWGLALLVAGAIALGWAICFFWQWWLLSRPGARPRS
jgi:hypothetical protein